MPNLDDTDRKIARLLVRDPRQSDNMIATKLKVSPKTVARKRRVMESHGVLSYFTHVNFQESGAGRFAARHLYIIKFSMGVTRAQLEQDIRSEPKVRSIFTELIYESHIAEIGGHVAMLLFVEGHNDAQIVDSVQGNIIKLLRKNHGDDSIIEVSSMRILAPVRVMHNYLPMVNVKDGKLRPDWPDAAIFVG